MRKREMLTIVLPIAIAILVIKLVFFFLFPTEVIVIDYSETKWQEIKGFKSKGYGFKVTIIYESKTDACREERSFFSAVDGTSGSYYIPKESTLDFDANISKDGLSYVLKYPLTFKEDLCEMWAQEITIDAHADENLQISSDFEHLLTEADKKLRSNKKRYDDLFAESVVKIIHSSKVHEETYDYPFNIYCQRSIFFEQKVNYVDDETREKEVWRPTAYCRPTDFHEIKTVVFLDLLNEAYNPLNINILFSEDVKCHRSCTDIQMNILGTKEKMYEGNRYDPATTDTRNEKFMPSDILFKAFKKEHHLGL